MPDREKVIKGLETCSHADEVGCDQCPYYGTRGERGCQSTMQMDALALLREQELEPAVPYSYLDAVGIVYGFKCPKCNSEIHEFQQYCDVCGRKVKWDA